MKKNITSISGSKLVKKIFTKSYDEFQWLEEWDHKLLTLTEKDLG